MPVAKQTTSAQETVNLIRDLARLYVSKPADVDVRVQESEDGAAYFGLKPAPEDESRMIGKAGSHVDALRFLIERVGLANGRPFSFRLITGDERTARLENPKAALSYDPTPAKNILWRWLSALGVGELEVGVGPGGGQRDRLSYEFTVKIADRAAAESLLPKERGESSVIEALGNLYRATGRQHGVSLQITLVDPNKP